MVKRQNISKIGKTLCFKDVVVTEDHGWDNKIRPDSQGDILNKIFNTLYFIHFSFEYVLNCPTLQFSDRKC